MFETRKFGTGSASALIGQATHRVEQRDLVGDECVIMAAGRQFDLQFPASVTIAFQRRRSRIPSIEIPDHEHFADGLVVKNKAPRAGLSLQKYEASHRLRAIRSFARGGVIFPEDFNSCSAPVGIGVNDIFREIHALFYFASHVATIGRNSTPH